MAVLVQKKAPDFHATAVVNRQFQDLSLSHYHGRYVVLFFYPLDFTFVCPTEILAFDDAVKDFEDRNCVVLGCSIDSHFTHLAWINTPRKEGGLEGLNYPLISDLSKDIAKSYDVLTEDNTVAMRGLFLIDKEGIVRHQVVNDLPLGRSVPEAIRVLDALQYFETHGEVCPANWKPGEKSMKADPSGSLEYFQAVHN